METQTPRKYYSRANICLICGICFTPTVENPKLPKQKLRLTADRVSAIKHVIESFYVPFTLSGDRNECGVCIKCYRKIENCINQEKLVTNIKKEVLSSWNIVRTHHGHNYEQITVKKRELSSPRLPPPKEKIIGSPVPVKARVQYFDKNLGLQSPRVPPVKERITSSPVPIKAQVEYFDKLTKIAPSSKSGKDRDAEASTCLPLPVCFVGSARPQTSDLRQGPLVSNVSRGRAKKLLPYTQPCQNDSPIIEGITPLDPSLQHEQFSKPESVMKENVFPLDPLYSSSKSAEFMVSATYPSGTKSVVVTNENHRKICKALIRGVNVEKVVMDGVCRENPEEVVKCTAKLAQDEASQICKRSFTTVLRQKKYEDFFSFSWDKLHEEIRIHCPSMTTLLSCTVADIPKPVTGKQLHHVMVAAAIGLHGRNQEMSAIQYMIGLVLVHGGCTKADIERLSHIGLTVHPETLNRTLASWQNKLDTEILAIKEAWENGGATKYQLVGDNWDKNILPSYRTSDRKTESLHLFNIYALVDRVPPPKLDVTLTDLSSLSTLQFIPSIEEQEKLMDELVFLFSRSIVDNVDQFRQLFQKVYPQHLQHKYSDFAGVKTSQYSLGLFDTNENKTNEMIQLLKHLTDKYVPCKDGKMVEPVFLGGDRLTDERVQGAKNAMRTAESDLERLEGIISKTEDFHRLMNFLEAIHKLTYSTNSSNDEGTAYYFRTILNMRNVKGDVKNSYRPHKLLYYTILDGLCTVMFFQHFGISELDDSVPIPDDFASLSDPDKIKWLNGISRQIIQKFFFENSPDIMSSVREVLDNPDHPENYWTNTIENDRTKCHHCDKTYARIGSLKAHEEKVHNVKIELPKAKKEKPKDELYNYILMMFKLVLLHKNLDSAVDMGDGERSVRSTKYELPIYNKTHKIKYVIGSIHLTALTSGVLPSDQCKSLIANRFVNLQGGKNNNIACDEYIEMLNRDSKNMCTGNQTKASIIRHSKEYPILINFLKHFDEISETRTRKGFHHLPSYREDVKKVAKIFINKNVLTETPGRHLACKDLDTHRDIYSGSVIGLSTMIHRHKPTIPVRRLRNDLV